MKALGIDEMSVKRQSERRQLRYVQSTAARSDQSQPPKSHRCLHTFPFSRHPMHSLILARAWRYRPSLLRRASGKRIHNRSFVRIVPQISQILIACQRKMYPIFASPRNRSWTIGLLEAHRGKFLCFLAQGCGMRLMSVSLRLVCVTL